MRNFSPSVIGIIGDIPMVFDIWSWNKNMLHCTIPVLTGESPSLQIMKQKLSNNHWDESTGGDKEKDEVYFLNFDTFCWPLPAFPTRAGLKRLAKLVGESRILGLLCQKIFFAANINLWKITTESNVY